MALFTVTISNLSPALDKQIHEMERIHNYLNSAAQAARAAGGKQTSGNILAPGGVTVVGSWTYTPQASQ
jgi:hypothetical protein